MKSSNEPKPQLRACGVYIFDESGERVLLTQRGSAARHEQFKWEAPGGQVEEGESYEQATIRETREEIGIDVRLDEILLKYASVTDIHGVTWDAQIFRGSISETPRLPDPTKVSGFGWFTLAEVKNLFKTGLIVSYATKDLEKLGWL